MNKTFDFGEALNKLKKGCLVARSGWNGKGMWLLYIPSDSYQVQLQMKQLPWIGMKTADNSFVPWLASQTDVLAEDWCVVDEV